LEDARGRRYLIDSLDDPDEDLREIAVALLDWLDMPAGNEALKAHGYELETGRSGGQDQIADLQPQAAAPESHTSAELDPSWAAYERMQLELERRMAPESMEQRQAVPSAGSLPGAGTLGASSAIILSGAIGGLLGLLTLNAALYALGSLPPEGIAAALWLRTTVSFYVPASLITGVGAAAVGRRIARAIEGQTMSEASEWGINPVFGALLSGAAAALVVNALLFLLVGA
jgi:hypothetical protein